MYTLVLLWAWHRLIRKGLCLSRAFHGDFELAKAVSNELVKLHSWIANDPHRSKFMFLCSWTMKTCSTCNIGEKSLGECESPLGRPLPTVWNDFKIKGLAVAYLIVVHPPSKTETRVFEPYTKRLCELMQCRCVPRAMILRDSFPVFICERFAKCCLALNAACASLCST